MKRLLSTTFFLFFLVATTIAQQNISFSTDKKPGVLTIYGHNNSDEDLEITLTLKNIKMLKGYTKPITKLVKAKSKVNFIDLTYKYDVYTYKMSYTYKKPETELATKLKNINKSDYYLNDFSKIDEGIVVFDDEGCGNCRLVVNYLVGNDIDFKIISLANNKDNQKFMWKTIKEKGASMKVKLPVIVVNGEVSHSHSDWNAFLKKLH